MAASFTARRTPPASALQAFRRAASESTHAIDADDNSLPLCWYLFIYMAAAFYMTRYFADIIFFDVSPLHFDQAVSGFLGLSTLTSALLPASARACRRERRRPFYLSNTIIRKVSASASLISAAARLYISISLEPAPPRSITTDFKGREAARFRRF